MQSPRCLQLVRGLRKQQSDPASPLPRASPCLSTPPWKAQSHLHTLVGRLGWPQFPPFLCSPPLLDPCLWAVCRLVFWLSSLAILLPGLLCGCLAHPHLLQGSVPKCLPLPPQRPKAVTPSSYIAGWPSSRLFHDQSVAVSHPSCSSGQQELCLARSCVPS